MKNTDFPYINDSPVDLSGREGAPRVIRNCTGNLIIEPHSSGAFQVFHDEDTCFVPHGVFDTREEAESLIAAMEASK